MNRKLGFGHLLALMLLILQWQSPLRAESIAVYGDSGYSPIIYLESGQPKGTLVEILKAVGRKSGDDYVLNLVPWKRALETSKGGAGAIVGISLNSERSAVFDFSDPIYSDDIQIVVLKGKEFPFNQLSDLKGKTLGGVLGASYGDAVDLAIKDGLFFVDRDIGQTSRLLKLLAGRFDGALIGNGQAGFEAALKGDAALIAKREKFAILKVPVAKDPLYLAIPKSLNNPGAITRFNSGLKQIQKSGELKKILGS